MKELRLPGVMDDESGHTITADKAVAGLTSQGLKFESRALEEALDLDPPKVK